METILSTPTSSSLQETSQLTAAQTNEDYIQIPALEECGALLMAAPAR